MIYVAQLQEGTTPDRPIIHVFKLKEIEMPKTLNVSTVINTVPGGTFKVRTQLMNEAGDTVIDEAMSQPVVVPADPPSTPNVEIPDVVVS